MIQVQTGHMLHSTKRIPVGLCLFAPGIFKNAKGYRSPYLEKVVTYALVRWIASVFFCSNTLRYFHGMNQWHAQHIHVKVRSRFHIISCKCEMVYTPNVPLKPTPAECDSLTAFMENLPKTTFSI